MRALARWCLAPAWVLNALLFLAPMGIMVAYSFMNRGSYGGAATPWTLANYLRAFDPLYGVILVRSFVMAGAATAVCLALGFPLALFITRSRHPNFWLQMVMLPFWTSFLVRMYAWVFLLRDTGLINTALQALGLIGEPLPLLYNSGAVMVGLIYGHLPFMVLPLYATLERLDRGLLEAAADLGARPAAALARVVIPLCRPGFVAGAILVFIPCLGAYLVPDLLGGSKTILVGNLVQNQFTTARDWPFGAAVSLLLMALVMVLLRWLGRQSEDLL
jgi:spermidine/putrescine transport system permease protein